MDGPWWRESMTTKVTLRDSLRPLVAGLQMYRPLAKQLRERETGSSSRSPWYVGKHLPRYTALQPRRKPSLFSPREPEILWKLNSLDIFPLDPTFNRNHGSVYRCERCRCHVRFIQIWKESRQRVGDYSRADAHFATCVFQGHCTWANVSGRQVTLTDTSLLTLCELERRMLQKVAVAKLQALNLGVTVRIPSGKCISVVKT